jgi:hypothetical protein
MALTGTLSSEVAPGPSDGSSDVSGAPPHASAPAARAAAGNSLHNTLRIVDAAFLTFLLNREYGASFEKN